MSIRIGTKTLVLAAGLLTATAAQAQQQQRPDFSKVEIKTTKLADNFYTLEGQGGAISVLTGPEGVLLVDSQFAPLTEKLVAAVREVSDKPIRFLVNTHVHGDHTGGNENFARLGATIFAREQLRERLIHPAPAADGTPGKPAVAEALPVVTYDDPVTIHIDGEHVRLLPIRSAHTDGDTLVSFPEHDILAVGDYYRSVGYPIVDLNNGGSLNGLLEALRVTIDRAGPNTKIIPGHGPIVDRNAVIAQRDLILAYRDKVAALVGQNKTLEEVLAAKLTADTDAQVQGAQSAERFIRWLYAEVKAAKAKV
jgi:glyoxylase-like metal-dependent hydrolase (beta-lactamase superfamily II)